MIGPRDHIRGLDCGPCYAEGSRSVWFTTAEGLKRHLIAAHPAECADCELDMAERRQEERLTPDAPETGEFKGWPAGWVSLGATTEEGGR